MTVYVDVVILLNFLVDLLLLLGTNRLAGFPLEAGRATAAAVLGGLYGGACLIPGFHFLGNFLWRSVSLGLMGVIAFGISGSALRRGVLFLLLSMALGGMAMSLGGGGTTVLTAAAGIALMCWVGFHRRPMHRICIPVTLEYGGKRVEFLALHDTGNTLRDPLTGEPVLVAGRGIGAKLLGMTPRELADPIAAMSACPGARLIPYRAVGKSQGMMLGIRVRQARIGKHCRSVLVAFAPEGLEGNGEYEALIGGEP